MMRRNKKNENYLDKIPRIKGDLDWEVEDDTVIVHQKNKGIYAKIAQKFFSSPETSHIRLEGQGSYVWQCIDGESSIYEIGKKVEKKFGKEAEPLYERLSQFMETLSRVGYIEFAHPRKGK